MIMLLEFIFFTTVAFIGVIVSVGLSRFFAHLITRELFGLKTFDKKKEDIFDKFD